MRDRWALLVLPCVLASLLGPALASTSPGLYAETRVGGLDLGNPHAIGAARAVTLDTHPGYGLVYDDLASDFLLAARGATRVTGPALQAARREFDRVVKPAYWKEYAMQVDDGVISNPFGGHADNLARMRAGQPPIGPDGLSVNLHHVQPLSYGGTNAFDNLVPINAITHQQMSGVLHSPPFP